MRLFTAAVILAATPSWAMAAPAPRFVVESPAPFAAYGETIDLQALSTAALSGAGCTVMAPGGRAEFSATVDAALSEGERAHCEYALSVTLADGKVLVSEPSVVEDKICSTVWLEQEISRAMIRACEAAQAHQAGTMTVPSVSDKAPSPPPSRSWQRPVGVGLAVAGLATLVALAVQHGSCDEEAADGACKSRNEGFGFTTGAVGVLGLIGGGLGLYLALGGTF